MLSYYSLYFSLSRLHISPLNNDKCKPTFVQHHFLSLCFSCFGEVWVGCFFFLLQAIFFSFFSPFPGGRVCPPLREPNEQNACLNSYRIFILYRAAGGMLCLFWCRAKFPTRTICLQSAPSLSLSGSQGK